MKKTPFVRLAAAGAFASLFALPAVAQEVTLKVHHFLSPKAPVHEKMLGPWCEKLAKDSNNRLKCQIYPAMQLGGTAPQLYDQAKDGVADIVWTLPGYSAGRFPLVEVFELPFMMTNAEATSRALWDYVNQFDLAEFKDVKPLAFHVHGPGNLFTTKKPVTQMADFKGMKFRAPTRMTNKFLGSLGATPVGMPLPQVGEALSKGVIDGAMTPYEVVGATKMHELTKFTGETDTKYPAIYTSVFIVAMNKAKYDSLPADLKKVLDANSGAEFSAWMGKVQQEADGPGKKLIQDHGNPVNIIPIAELEKWKQASDALDDEWAADVTKKGHDGKKLLQAARDLIKKHTK
ncbi:MAG: TRAP transporter substrate-binding protein [Rhodocyclaceae bacterium]|nr:TRAP transporter substrate-binding protein [Rhodocyclaceae bacterium]